MDHQVAVAMVVVAALLAVGVYTELPPAPASYKILMLEADGTISTRNFIFHLAEALADRGHKVEMLTSVPAKRTDKDITQHKTSFRYLDDDTFVGFDLMDQEGEVAFYGEFFPPLVSELYSSPVVMELYRRRKEFDLITVDHVFNEMTYPFLHEMPFITIATFGMDPHQSAMLGNVLHPAYTPPLLETHDLSWIPCPRLVSAIHHILYGFYFDYWFVMPKIQQEVTKLFPDLPPLLEIQRNQSLVLVNSHFSIGGVQPLLPSQVEVAGMHCHPGKPLPKELAEWVAGAGEAGVVYFSLGSLTKGKMMPAQYRDLFVQAFRKLPQRVIWKFEGDLPGVSDNVLTSSWLPQQDILGDYGVKVFISHGGVYSTQEAMFHGTPVIGIPIHMDQHKNAQNLADMGLGLHLKWKELTVEVIIKTIQEVINNPKYSRKAREVSTLLQDQPLSPLERAVFWTEYVIRHRGAPQLRSPAQQLSWTEFLMLDLLAVSLLGLVIVCYVLCTVLRAIMNFTNRKLDAKTKKD